MTEKITNQITNNEPITKNEKPKTITILKPPTKADNPITKRKRKTTNKQTRTEITKTSTPKITQMLKPRSTLANTTITGNKLDDNISMRG